MRKFRFSRRKESEKTGLSISGIVFAALVGGLAYALCRIIS